MRYSSNPQGGVLAADDGYLSSVQVCQMAGITYRQLDHWIRCGWIHPQGSEDLPGSGYRRLWTHLDAEIVVRLADRRRRAQEVLDRFATGALWHDVWQEIRDEQQ